MAAEDYSDLIAAAEDYSDLIAAAPEDGGPESFLSPKNFKPTQKPAPRQFNNTGPIDQVRRDLDPQQYPTPWERVKRGAAMGADPAQSSPFDVEGIGPSVEEGMAFTKAHGRPMDPMEADPMAQSVALGMVLGPLGRAAANTLAPSIGAIPAGAATGAAEAYLGAKSTGAPAGEATAFGGLFGGIGGAASGRPSAKAAAANDAQMVKDVKRGATKAPKAMADDVDFRADQLIDSSKDSPELRKSLVTQARSNPAAAERATQGSLDLDVAANDRVFDAIEQHHGPVPLNVVTDRLAGLEARLYQEGHTVAQEATGRILDRLNRQYGGNAGSTLTAEQLRNIRNDLGDIAFPGVAKEARPNAARGALGDVYNEFNGAIEDIASTVPGVDVDALRASNRRISSLMPAQKALGERVSLEADRELGMFGTAKDKLKKGATGINRRLRYGREQTGGGGGDNSMLMGLPSYGAMDAPPQEIPMDDEQISPAALAARLVMRGGPR